MSRNEPSYNPLPVNDSITLVTGATGMTGSCLVQDLVGKHKKVRALYRTRIPSFPGSGDVQWIRADILDPSVLEDCTLGVEEVYHCAAVVSFHPNYRKTVLKTNIEGTAHVVNACIFNGVRKLVYMSSVAALGRNSKNIPINESMNWTEENQTSVYAKSKFYAEMEVWRGMGEGLQTVIVNPSVILGAGDWDKGSTEIFKSVYQEFPWYTKGVNGFVDVQDVVAAMQLLMDSDISGQRFILNGSHASYQELFNTIAGKFGKKKPSRNVSPLLADLICGVENIKGRLTGKEPLLTRETARTALSQTWYDNRKFLTAFPAFTYPPLDQSLERICRELTEKYRS